MPKAKSRQNVCLIAHVSQALTSTVATTHHHRVAGLRLSGEESLTYVVNVPAMPPTPLNCALAQWWDNAVTHFLRESLKIVEVTYVAANGARPSEEICCTQPAAGP